MNINPSEDIKNQKGKITMYVIINNTIINFIH